MFKEARNFLPRPLTCVSGPLHVSMQTRLYQRPHHYVLGRLPFRVPLACTLLPVG